ncbi:MAG: Transposase [Verrucomicrobiota bacterium]|jgi:transposase-like protein
MSTITAEVVDTGEKRDARGRRVTPGARRRQLVQAYRGGGLTMADFARREGINYSTFAGWVAKAAREPVPRAPVRFAEVALPLGAAEAAPLEVRLPDGTVLRGPRVAELAALVRALRA